MEKRRRSNGVAVAVLLLFSGLVFAQPSNKQRELEKQFDASMKADNLRNWMKRLSARPHHVGFVIASPDPYRVRYLQDEYTRRIYAAFFCEAATAG